VREFSTERRPKFLGVETDKRHYLMTAFEVNGEPGRHIAARLIFLGLKFSVKNFVGLNDLL
jgi:hypothetical protein